ncbi:MAG: pilus assembly protein [Thermoleophilia bacterium]|nr:pilus assembly protein [Thermoleophilia bacterium]
MTKCWRGYKTDLIIQNRRGHYWMEFRPAKLRSLNHEGGAAAVEFALVLPMLLIILFGILDWGLYLYNDLLLTHAARDAARYLSVNNESGAEATLNNAKQKLISVQSTTVSTVVGSSGNEAEVTLTATYNFITPLPNLLPGIGGGSVNIDASAVMRRE